MKHDIKREIQRRDGDELGSQQDRENGNTDQLLRAVREYGNLLDQLLAFDGIEAPTVSRPPAMLGSPATSEGR